MPPLSFSPFKGVTCPLTFSPSKSLSCPLPCSLQPHILPLALPSYRCFPCLYPLPPHRHFSNSSRTSPFSPSKHFSKSLSCPLPWPLQPHILPLALPPYRCFTCLYPSYPPFKLCRTPPLSPSKRFSKIPSYPLPCPLQPPVLPLPLPPYRRFLCPYSPSPHTHTFQTPLVPLPSRLRFSCCCKRAVAADDDGEPPVATSKGQTAYDVAIPPFIKEAGRSWG